MALYKEIAAKSGVVLRYWRIGRVEVDNEARLARLAVLPYVSAEARQQGLPYLAGEVRQLIIKDYDFSGTEYESRSNLDYTQNFSPAALEKAGKDLYKVAYGYLKGLPSFAEAEDI